MSPIHPLFLAIDDCLDTVNQYVWNLIMANRRYTLVFLRNTQEEPNSCIPENKTRYCNFCTRQRSSDCMECSTNTQSDPDVMYIHPNGENMDRLCFGPIITFGDRNSWQFQFNNYLYNFLQLRKAICAKTQ